MRSLGRLEDTLLLVVADHGHSLGDGQYLGSAATRHGPRSSISRSSCGCRAGSVEAKSTSASCSTLDNSASAPDAAGLDSDQLDGRPLLRPGGGVRDHVTVGWGLGADRDRRVLVAAPTARPTALASSSIPGRQTIRSPRTSPTPIRTSSTRCSRPRSRMHTGSFPEWILELAAAEQVRAGVQPDGGAALMDEATCSPSRSSAAATSRSLACCRACTRCPCGSRRSATRISGGGGRSSALRRRRAHASHSELLADGGVEAVLVAVGPDTIAGSPATRWRPAARCSPKSRRPAARPTPSEWSLRASERG